jgi:nuclear pore complex protein Nup160
MRCKWLALSQFLCSVSDNVSISQHSAVRELVGVMVAQHEGERLCAYPWVGLQDEVDEALDFKCQHTLDVSVGPPFHQVLYAWRIRRGDYRGGK